MLHLLIFICQRIERLLLLSDNVEKAHVHILVVNFSKCLQMKLTLITEICIISLEYEFNEHEIDVEGQKGLECDGKYATTECLVRIASAIEIQIYDMPKHVLLTDRDARRFHTFFIIY